MLRVILFVFNQLTKSIAKYQEKQDTAIQNVEKDLDAMRKNLMTADKLAKKLEL